MKLNGKGNWSPPTTRELSGLWDFKDMPEGRLDFYFTIDPIEYKKEMQKINKMIAAAEADGKPIAKNSQLLKPM